MEYVRICLVAMFDYQRVYYENNRDAQNLSVWLHLTSVVAKVDGS